MDPGNAKINSVSICGKWIYTHGVVVDQPESARTTRRYRTVHGQTTPPGMSFPSSQHYVAGGQPKKCGALGT